MDRSAAHRHRRDKIPAIHALRRDVTPGFWMRLVGSVPAAPVGLASDLHPTRTAETNA